MEENSRESYLRLTSAIGKTIASIMSVMVRCQIMAMIQIIRMTLSKIPPFRMTEMAAINTVKRMTHAIAITTSIQVTGRASLIFSMTG